MNDKLLKFKIKSLYLPSVILGIAFGVAFSTVFCNDLPNSVLQMFIMLILIVSCIRFVEDTYEQELKDLKKENNIQIIRGDEIEF